MTTGSGAPMWRDRGRRFARWSAHVAAAAFGALGRETNRLALAAAEAGRTARAGWTGRTSIAAALFLAAALVPLAVADPLRRASFASALYVALAAVGLNVTVGLAGMPSLGQGAFVGIGAFGAALLTTRAGWDSGAAVVVAVALAAGAGLLVGSGASRLRGPFVAVATWVVAWLVAFALAAFPALSGGAQGLVVPEGRVNIPWTGLGFRLTPAVHYEVALVLVSLALLAFGVVARSPAGLALAAARRGSTMAAVAALRTRPLHLGAFTVSAAVGGLAGALLVQLAGIADPTAYGPLLSVELFVAVLLGGAGTLLGPVIGAAVLVVLPTIAHGAGTTAGASRFQPVITAVLLLAALLVGRGGLVRLFERWLIPRWRRSDQATTESVPEAPKPKGAAGRRTVGREPRRSSDGPPVLVADGLTKRFGGVTALDGLSVAFSEGRIHAIIGPNGSGKTTLLRTLAGAVVPDDGRVSLDGRDVTGLPPWERSRAGIARTPARTTVVPELTALQHIEAALWSEDGRATPFRIIVSTPRARAEMAGIRSRAEEVLALLDLSAVASRPASELSGADQRLIMLATACARGPRVLLADEPSSGLSGPDAERIIRALITLRAAGTTVVLVEHNLGVVRVAADVVTVLDAGAVIAEGTPGRIARRRAVLDAYLGEAASELARPRRRTGGRSSAKRARSSTSATRKR
ncbi:MAG: branched-chain amino acid ABC transporter ATP-binding protein/permease [Actinomycetota bacterium]